MFKTVATHKGCKIIEAPQGFSWEDMTFGAEADEWFPSIEAAKADIDLFFGEEPAPRVVANEIYA